MHQEVTNKLGSLLQGKVAVADTSSLLISGTHLLSTISECTLIIPAVVVQELEKKRVHPTLGILARQWINFLEEYRLSHGIELSKGVALVGHEDVLLRVEPNHSNQGSLPQHLQDGSNDSTILAVAKNFESEFPGQVVLLSNDTPMRLHATLDLNMDAYEFLATDLEDPRPYNARVTLPMTQDEFIDLGLTHGTAKVTLPQAMLDRIDGSRGHFSQVDVSFSDADEAPVTFLLEGSTIKAIPEKIDAHHIFARTVEQAAALEYLTRPASDLPIVSIGGSAGTGKTLVTVAAALSELKARRYQKVVVFRSLHEMGKGQEMGFLPGDVNEKMKAWAGAIFDAIDVIAAVKKPMKKNEGNAAQEDRKKVAEKLAECIEISPITYLRGRSLSNSYIILDEAQNFSRTELLNIISRVGTDSKIVLLWDSAQVDNKFLQAGSKADIWSVIKHLKDEDLFAHVSLARTERSRVAELASRILERES